MVTTYTGTPPVLMAWMEAVQLAFSAMVCRSASITNLASQAWQILVQQHMDVALE